MDETLFLYLKDFSIEVIVISLLIFGLTMLIKWPIKKATDKLSDDKRKAVNTAIIIIPMALSLLLNILYYGIFKHIWVKAVVFESVATCYLAATVIYAVYARLIIVFKGLKSPTAQAIIEEQQATTEAINLVTSISESETANIQKLNDVVNQINTLLAAKNQIVSNIALKGVANLDEIDDKLQALDKQKQTLIASIEQSTKTPLAG